MLDNNPRLTALQKLIEDDAVGQLRRRDGLMATVVKIYQFVGEAPEDVFDRVLAARTSTPTVEDWRRNRSVLSEENLIQEVLWLQQIIKQVPESPDIIRKMNERSEQRRP